MEGDKVVLEGTSDGTYPVTWAPALGLTFDGNQLRPLASPAVTTTYRLSAQVGNCTDQSSVTVTVTRYTPSSAHTWLVAPVAVTALSSSPKSHV